MLPLYYISLVFSNYKKMDGREQGSTNDRLVEWCFILDTTQNNGFQIAFILNTVRVI